MRAPHSHLPPSTDPPTRLTKAHSLTEQIEAERTNHRQPPPNRARHCTSSPLLSPSPLYPRSTYVKHFYSTPTPVFQTTLLRLIPTTVHDSRARLRLGEDEHVGNVDVVGTGGGPYDFFGDLGGGGVMWEG